MLYLNKVASYLPPGRGQVMEMAGGLHLTPATATLYQKVYGLDTIALAEGETLRDLLDQALTRILPVEDADRKRIKYIFHCHAAPCVCPAGAELVSALQRKHGLQHAVAVGLAQDQCATPLTALRLAEVLLADESDDAQVLLLTGEISFQERLRVIPNTTIIGDASAACLVGKRGDHNAVLTLAQRKFEHAAVQPTTPGIPVPATSYGEDLIHVIRDALDAVSMKIEDLSLILVHNVNAISWKFFARNFPCSPELLFLDNIPKAGHCFTSDPFINYCDAVQTGRLKPGDHFMMVSVGTTSTFAAVVLRH
ncbi:MAG: 3-oxoacyl-[acyl-carrier-protein] synthase III C-terminal domain-containing protein [Moraxellaceae bacterium]|nr:3-oxoacyl-[acyl-carrier-protein] synthase III C-terminal domain-containing protein [Moraxellaceae bacterium]